MDSEAPKRDDKGRLLPGHTANPGGVPKWVRAVREHMEGTAAKAAQLLEDVIDGKPVDITVNGEQVTMTPELSDRIRAAEIVLSYTVPKPTAKSEVEVTGVATRLDQLTRDEVLALARGEVPK